MLIRYPRRVTVNNKRLISKHIKSEKNISRSVGQRENSMPSHKHSLRGYNKFLNYGGV